MITVPGIKKVYTRERREYAPAGFCIYCRTTDGSLTNEHIVPFGIAGNSFVLKQASCTSCAKIIGEFETFLLRKAWREFRATIGFPSRKKKHPSSFQIGKYEGKKSITSKAFSAMDTPSVLALPALPQPGIVAGRPPTDSVKFGTWYLHRGLGDFLAEGQEIRFRYGPMAFCRLLAKIAHGFVMAELGLRAFNPAIVDIILGKSPFPQTLHHVGGDMTSLQDYRAPPPSKLTAHTIRWRQQHSSSASFLVVDIRLFDYLGAPQYHVVIGRFRPTSANAETAPSTNSPDNTSA